MAATAQIDALKVTVSIASLIRSMVQLLVCDRVEACKDILTSTTRFDLDEIGLDGLQMVPLALLPLEAYNLFPSAIVHSIEPQWGEPDEGLIEYWCQQGFKEMLLYLGIMGRPHKAVAKANELRRLFPNAAAIDFPGSGIIEPSEHRTDCDYDACQQLVSGGITVVPDTYHLQRMQQEGMLGTHTAACFMGELTANAEFPFECFHLQFREEKRMEQFMYYNNSPEEKLLRLAKGNMRRNLVVIELYPALLRREPSTILSVIADRIRNIMA